MKMLKEVASTIAAVPFVAMLLLLLLPTLAIASISESLIRVLNRLCPDRLARDDPA